MKRCTGYSLALMFAAHAAWAADKRVHETCFPAVLFAQGATISIKLENQGGDARDVTVQRYSASGTILESVARKIAGMAATEVRLSAASERPEFGWVRVLDEGRGAPALVKFKHEFLSGSDLSSVSNDPVVRFPSAGDAVRDPRRYPTTHKPVRYTLHLTEGRSLAFFFVNLSDYPVQVSACEADYPCTNPTLPYKVLPLAQIGFPIDRRKRFLVLDSSPCYSVASGWEAISVESSIQFLPTGTVAPVGTSPTQAPRHPASTGDPQTAEDAERVAFPPPMPAGTGVWLALNFESILVNSEAAWASQAASAGPASAGHTPSQKEQAELVQRGQASRCAVVTVPPGAEIDVDGNKAGVSPFVFLLLKRDTARTVAIKMSGYKTVEKTVVPDGKTISIGLILEKQ